MKIEITKNELQEILSSGLDGLERLKEIATKQHPEILYREKRWEEFGEVEGYSIDLNSDIIPRLCRLSRIVNRNIYTTKKEAEMALAMCQLLQWRDKYNGCKIDDWCDWSDDEQKKSTIIRVADQIEVGYSFTDYEILAFPEMEIADQFLKVHKTLIHKAFGL